MPGLIFSLPFMLFPVLNAQAEYLDAGLEGRVRMAGEIHNSACDIDLKNPFQIIEMSTDTVSQILRTGYGNTQFFSIYLTGCPGSVNGQGNKTENFLRLAFDGPSDNGLLQVLGGVKGVGLQILDNNDVPLVPGTLSSPYVIESNDMRMDYKIRLKYNREDFKLGDYTSIIRYKIDYF